MATNFRTLICILIFLTIPRYLATDTITQGQQIRDGEQLTSDNNLFRLQFFGSGTSRLRYLGIFYNRPPPRFPTGDEKAVWVANRNNPIPDASGNLMIDVDGKLKLLYAGNNAVSLFDSMPANETGDITATLLNSGNLVVRERDSNQVLWQSFDYPTDTFLPGMKLGFNLRTGQVWSLTSWISDELPASGSFRFGLDPNMTNQLIVWWREGNITWTTGPWSNGRFANTARLSRRRDGNFTYVSNEDEIYFTYSVRYRNDSYPRYTVNQDGDLSGEEGLGSPFGNCFIRFADIGCVEQNLPECRRKYYWAFVQRQGIIHSDGIRFDESLNYSLFDCERFCINDCSCVAYASTSYNKTGCQIWRKGYRFLATTNSLDHVYMFSQDRDSTWWIWLCVGLGIFLILLAIAMCCIVKRCKRRRKKQKLLGLNQTSSNKKYSSINNQESYEKMGDDVHLFSYKTIAAATNNFSITNKLGEGEFGPVYKGILPDGQEVAIKKLSSSSGQGVVEFKNEIMLISELKHTNLVRILGCCIEADEKSLVYEYMPNKSLDFYLFDSSKSGLLSWTDRFRIIEGIAQGLLYLHKHSRLRVIQRDLKARNILLDGNLNPKISDFCMGRICGMNQDNADTNRLVGTYGYVSPEYAVKGIESIKTDVFSFGVLVLEIVTGKKNNSCFELEQPLNLIGHAWKLWKEGRGLELIDPKLEDFYPEKEAIRCIQVGLLCVQDQADDRPSISDVVSVLTNETKEVYTPKQPVSFLESSSTNEITTFGV